MPLGLVSRQALLISCSTRSVKLPFFQKAAAVIVIVDLACIAKNGGRRRMYKTNLSKHPSPFLLKVVCKMWGAYFSTLLRYSASGIFYSMYLVQGSLLCWYYICIWYNEGRTYCQVMTGVTSSWMSTVAPPFSSATTTCSWPSWHEYIIAVHLSWSKMTITGVHSDKEHELSPTGS